MVANAAEAFESWRTMSLAKRAELFFRDPRAASTPIARTSPGSSTAEHGKVLSDAMGEVARGLEVIEFACGIPTLAQGRLLRAGLDRGSTSTRSASRSASSPGITPFNFPAMVPMWMWAPARRVRQLLRPQAVREGSLRVAAHRGAAQGGRASPTASSTSSTATRSPSTRCSSTRTSRRSAFVGSTPIARYIYETGTKHGKRVQALGGAKNHMIVLPDADIDMAADAAVSAGYGSAGERCMAVSVVVAVGDVADPLVAGDQGAAPEGQGRRRPRARVRDGAARDPRASRQGRLVPRLGRRPGRDGRRRRPRDGTRGRRLLPRRLAARQRDARRWTPTATRSSGRCSPSCAPATYDEAVGLVNDNPYGNGVALFTRDGGAARQFQFDVEAGMVGHQRPDPGAGRLLLVRRLEGVALRRLARVRARVDPLLHARQGRHVPVARPGHEHGRPRLPADALDERGNRLARHR